MEESFIDNLQDFGHILIYAPTDGGKTTLTKYIATKLKFSEIIIFTATPEQYEDFKPKKCNVRVYSSDQEFDQVAEDILKTEGRSEQHKQTYKVDGNNCIILDDFNEQINANQNNNYKQIFTRGRHKGIRIINLGHDVKAIGKVARKNAQYVFISSQMGKDQIKEINDLFSNTNYIQIIQRLVAIKQNRRNYLLSIGYGNEFKNISADQYFNQEDSESDEEDQQISNLHQQQIQPYRQNQRNQQQEEIKITNDYVPAEGSALYNGENPRYFNPIQTQLNLMNKQAGRDIVDNSTNNVKVNIDWKIKNEQRILDQSTNHYINIQKIKYSDAEQRENEKYILRDLILKKQHSLNDIKLIVQLLRKQKWQTNIVLDEDSWHLFADQFLQQKFGINYVPIKEDKKKSIKQSIINDVPLIGQQIVEFNTQKPIETFFNLKSVMSKYLF